MSWILIWNSLWLGFATTMSSILIGIIVGLAFVMSTRFYRSVIVASVIVAAALPGFLVADIWMVLGGNGSWLRETFSFDVFGKLGAWWVLTLLHWPWAALLLAPSVMGIDRGLVESDPLLRGWSLFRWVIFPSIRSSVLQAGIGIGALVMGQFTIPSLLGVRTLPVLLWTEFNGTFNFASAFLHCLPYLGIVGVLLLWAKPLDCFQSCHASNGLDVALKRALGSTLTWLTCVLALIIVFISVALPIGLLVSDSNAWKALPSAAFANSEVLLWSGLTAIVTSITTTALGLCLISSRRGSILWSVFWLPGIALGILLIYIFNRPGLDWIYQSMGIVWIGYCLRFAAVGWASARLAFKDCPKDLLDDAQLCGCGKWSRLWRIVVPIGWKRIWAGGYVVYLLALWDVELLTLLTPPGSRTLALDVFNLLHYGHTELVRTLSVLAVCLGLLPWVLWKSVSTLNQFVLTKFRTGLGCFVLVLGVCSATVGCGKPKDEVREAELIQSKIFANVTQFGSRGMGLGFFNKPRSLTLDSFGSVYVVDMTGRVQRFDDKGSFQLFWQMPQTDLGKPKGVTFDPSGRIVVVEPHYARVNHFDRDGNLKLQWGTVGTETGKLTQPRAVAINKNGEIYISEFGGRERIQRFTPDGGKLLNVWGHTGSNPGEFNRAEGLTVDSDGNVWVADSCNHRIQVFTAEGKLIRVIGSSGKSLGQFSYPYDIALGPDNFIYVCEFGNSRIQILNSLGVPIELIGKSGHALGELNNPWSIAIDKAGNLYVADSGNHRVQRFERRKS